MKLLAPLAALALTALGGAGVLLTLALMPVLAVRLLVTFGGNER